ncbi:MAG TPA: ATP-dependent metallopeptidase FtsH/Yme1/Tma family protein [candidate division Zixibacteria bacterium]|nr:ATP-dependent metallopeptidase FtsH/Yme1/Tma family protein [candidate division Zixibacteria bacterium]
MKFSEDNKDFSRPPSGNKGRQRKDNPNDKDSFSWKGPVKSLGFWVVIILAFIFAYSLYSTSEGDVAEISYSEFINQLNNGNIASVTFVERTIEGRLSQETSLTTEKGTDRYTKFKARIPFDDNSFTLVNRLEEANVVIDAKTKGPNYFSLLMSFAPWLLLIFIWLFFLRQMQGASGQKGLFSFGKSRAKLLTDERPKVTFDDVAGVDEAKVELQEIIEFLKDPGKFQKLGGKIPKGALLLGPPGSGKTLLARAVAGEAGVPFFSMSGSDFVEMFVGVGASRVRDLFEQGKKNAPCIIFIDEIDAVGRHRGAGLGGGHDEREQTLNQLLVEMDGFESNDGVILVAATNRPDILDPALLRPGRFDRQIVVDAPDVRGREGILKVHTKKIKLGNDIRLDILARGTPGLSGADLANMVNEAALLAARNNSNAVSMSDFEEAKDKVMMGAERRSMVIPEEEKKVIAYHEAGHALMAKFLPDADPVHKVTIIPRGMALGVTHYLPVDERHIHTKRRLETRLVYAMGGRLAEKIVFNQTSTGAGNDLERATEIAQKMVCQWGMSEKLGPITYGKREEQIFLGREIAQHRDYSEETARVIDEEVKRILIKAEETGNRILTENRDKLDKLAKALLEHEAISGSQIDEIIGLDGTQSETAPEPAPEIDG